MNPVDWIGGKCMTCRRHVYRMPYEFSLGHGHVYDVITEMEYEVTGTCGWCFDRLMTGV